MKSLDKTGILEKTLRVSKGNDSILWSIRRINDSIPEVGRGKLLSYAANSPGAPLPPGFPAGCLGGGYFLSSFLRGAPLAPAGGCYSSSSCPLRTVLMIPSRLVLIDSKNISRSASIFWISCSASLSRFIRSSSMVIGVFYIANLF